MPAKLDNMVKYLDLILGLYPNDAANYFSDNKATRQQRTVDENIAILTYSLFMGKMYYGTDSGVAGQNQAGKDRVKYTKGMIFVPL